MTSCSPSGDCSYRESKGEWQNVERVRAAVVATGVGQPLVRTARVGDPAPVGDLILAVTTDSGCVLGRLSDQPWDI